MSKDAVCCAQLFDGALSSEDAVDLASVFKALADPVRLRIVSVIAASQSGEVCACEFPDLLDRTQPTNSHHLTQLTDAGVLTRTQRGKWAWFRLVPERLQALGEVLTPRPTAAVLFLCVHNAGRSQMAAAWTRHLAGDRVRVFSGGSDPGQVVNPQAVAAMAEVGIDISAEQPATWTMDGLTTADVVVSMGCGDACPVLPGKRYEDWDLADPAGQPIEFVRKVRDDIRARVEGLLASLGVTAG